MKKISISSLAKLDYDCRVLNVLRQFYKTDNTWSCVGSPKKCHLLSFYRGMDAEYKRRDGKIFTVKDGGAVLTAEGGEYSVRFLPHSPNGQGIGINFRLLLDGEEISFEDGIAVFDGMGEVMERLFCRAEENFLRSDSPALQKASLLRLLSALGEGVAARTEENPIISDGVRYLREHFTENFSLLMLSELCHISDVYFRRLFLMQIGMSPAEYRIYLRTERAKSYLAYTQTPVSEIAELLGYSDGAFFIRQFKKKTGKTPLEYRKLYTV